MNVKITISGLPNHKINKITINDLSVEIFTKETRVYLLFKKLLMNPRQIVLKNIYNN